MLYHQVGVWCTLSSSLSPFKFGVLQVQVQVQVCGAQALETIKEVIIGHRASNLPTLKFGQFDHIPKFIPNLNNPKFKVLSSKPN